MPRVPEIAGTVSALNITPVLSALERLGYDGARILAAAGSSFDALQGPHARVPASFEFAFWDAVAAHTRDPLISLRLADCISVGALGAYEYLVRNSCTLRAAIEQANRFERVMDDYGRVSILEAGEQATLRIWREGGWEHPGLGTECLFASVVRVVAQVIEGQQARQIRFAHESSADPRRFAEHFGCPVLFAQPYNEIDFARVLLDQMLPAADPALSAVLEEHMTHVLQKLPSDDPLVERVRRELGATLPSGEFSLDELAQRLRLSARTLRRRLSENGTSYKKLLDEQRRELALHQVARNTTSFDEIAAKLGFADTSAFYRAFKRWTGTTPAAYREHAS